MTLRVTYLLASLAWSGVATAGGVEQGTSGPCSPAINGNGNTVNCSGVDPRAVTMTVAEQTLSSIPESVAEQDTQSGFSDHWPWHVVIYVEAKFRSTEFNSIEGLSAIADLEPTIVAEKIGTYYNITDNYSLRDYLEDVQTDPKKFSGILRWRFVITSENKPSLENLLLKIGAWDTKFSIPDVQWKPITSMGQGLGVRLVVEMPDPDWVTIDSARFLKRVTGEPILEVVVTNHSKKVYSMNEMVIEGLAPRGGPLYVCGGPDWHPLTLNWPKIVSTPQSADAASTTIDDEPISVKTEFIDNRCTSDYVFRAFVPVSIDFKSGDTRRLFVPITQTPVFGPPHEDENTPPHDANGFNFYVSLKPEAHPRQVSAGQPIR